MEHRSQPVSCVGGVLWTCGYGGSFWFGAGALGLNLRGTVPELRMVMPFVQEGTEILQAWSPADRTNGGWFGF